MSEWTRVGELVRTHRRVLLPLAALVPAALLAGLVPELPPLGDRVGNGLWHDLGIVALLWAGSMVVLAATGTLAIEITTPLLSLRRADDDGLAALTVKLADLVVELSERVTHLEGCLEDRGLARRTSGSAE